MSRAIWEIEEFRFLLGIQPCNVSLQQLKRAEVSITQEQMSVISVTNELDLTVISQR